MEQVFNNGSRWLKVDFHLHTNADKEFKYTGDNREYLQNYIEALIDKDIKIGCITNHNKFNQNEYKQLKKEAIKNDIFLLPGVELSVADGSNGIHTLIVFDEKDWLNGEDHINKFLDSVFLGIDNRENENARCRSSLLDVLKTLNTLNK
ncbi:MAG: hypothetical protein MJA82_18980, partial [Clostridia bacterium]|nr:hypothetical protein [Clostridia bacterium]